MDEKLLDLLRDLDLTAAFAAALRLALMGHAKEDQSVRNDGAVQQLSALVVDRLEAHGEQLAALQKPTT